MISNGTITVDGYQRFSIDENEVITFKGNKYSYIVELLKGLKRVDDCTTFADVGANTGLVSFLASSSMVGFQHALLLDHDIPCISIASAISAAINANVTAKRFDFVTLFLRLMFYFVEPLFIGFSVSRPISKATLMPSCNIYRDRQINIW